MSAISINTMPNEMLERIYDYLDLRDLGRCEQVCNRWREILERDAIWRKILLIIDPALQNLQNPKQLLINKIKSKQQQLAKLGQNSTFYEKIFSIVAEWILILKNIPDEIIGMAYGPALFPY